MGTCKCKKLLKIVDAYIKTLEPKSVSIGNAFTFYFNKKKYNVTEEIMRDDLAFLQRRARSIKRWLKIG